MKINCTQSCTCGLFLPQVVVYVGLSFLKEKLRFSTDIRHAVTFSAVDGVLSLGEERKWSAMKREILKEMEHMNTVCIGGKTNFDRLNWDSWNADDGVFVRVSNSMLLFKHSYQAPFSLVFTSQLIKIPFVKFSDMECIDYRQCLLHQNHDFFLPYFMDDEQLRIYCWNSIESCENEDHRNTLNSLMTQYKDKASGMHSWDYSEDKWTQRLCNCLFEYNAECTANRKSCLDPSEFNVPIPTKFYPFHGVPDILISGKPVIMGAASDCVSSGDESEDDKNVIELALQRYPMKSRDTYKVPEKLVSCLHFILACKLIRKLLKGKNTEKSYSTKGILLDKPCRTVQCRVVGKWSSPGSSCPMTVEDIHAYGGFLNPLSLCCAVQHLVGQNT